MISHYTKYKFNTNLLPNHNKTIICQQYLFSMWLPPWLFRHITHGFEVTIAKWSVAASGLIAKRLGFKMGNCFAGKIKSHTQVVHSREAWGFEWTSIITCVLLTQTVTVTMCIIEQTTAKHDTTHNHSMIHGACSEHQLEQGPRISHCATHLHSGLGSHERGPGDVV